MTTSTTWAGKYPHSLTRYLIAIPPISTTAPSNMHMVSLIGPQSDDDVLLVDIGGGDAGDLGLLRKALGKEVKGRLVLQELKHIVDRTVEDGFEAEVGDWNQVQPIKGTLPELYRAVTNTKM